MVLSTSLTSQELLHLFSCPESGLSFFLERDHFITPEFIIGVTLISPIFVLMRLLHTPSDRSSGIQAKQSDALTGPLL